MTNEDNFLTVKEKESLEEELKNLKEVERIEVIEQLKVARSYGDLSENAEYDAARKKQGIIESRIVEIEGKLQGAKVVKEDHKKEKVTIGNSVEVEVENEGKKIYDIGVKGKGIEVSPHAPVAEALLEKKVGETLAVLLPKGEVEMTILRIL